ncbi:MAG: hypothetical protein R6V20_00905 [Desulfobia sp.]
MTRITFLLTFFAFFFSATAATGFSFSDYEKQQKKLDTSPPTQTEQLSSINCPEKLKSQRIALIIAEEQEIHNWHLRQREYRPFYQVINRGLQNLGLKICSPAKLKKQVAEKEIKALIRGDTEAALKASRQLEADYFIKGLISRRSRLNRLVGIQEVFVSMDFTLSDREGRVISQSRAGSASFSGADTTSAALQLIEKNADRVVAELYRDLCKWMGKHPSGQATALKKGPAENSIKSNITRQKGFDSYSKSATPNQEGTDRVQTVIVSAEGLADPSSETYQGDRGLMIDALRQDARRQAIEKAVGTFVDSSTLVENFQVINDRVLSRSSGLIKKIIKQTSPWQGKDGLMHMLIKAEVFVSDVKDAVSTLSENQRLKLIRESGNPTISVAVRVKDAARGSSTPPENSTVAENILKEKFKGFGFRVWSENYSRRLKGKYAENRREADFSLIGETKFSRQNITLPGSGARLTRHILTSWTVKCVNNHTGEEIYFNNQIPEQKTWDHEDKALRDVGRLIGEEFNREFFSNYLNRPSTIFQMEITGLPSYDTALLIKKDLVGLRPVLNVAIRDFNSAGLSVFEVEFAGSLANFSQIVNNAVLKPLNAKLGETNLRLAARHGNVIQIAFKSDLDTAQIKNRLESMPPASLAQAAPERINSLIHNRDILEKIIALNPHLGGNGGMDSGRGTTSATSIMQDF